MLNGPFSIPEVGHIMFPSVKSMFSEVFNVASKLHYSYILHAFFSTYLSLCYAGRFAISPLLQTQLSIFRYLADLDASGTARDDQARNAFRLYQSCLDSRTIESLRAQPLLDVLRDTLLGTLI
jgi:hypothetical protein